MDRVIGNYTSQANKSFPLDCETLASLQQNIDMLGTLGNMVGDKTILSGCALTESGGRTEGYVFLKTSSYPMGEVLHYGGSSASSDYVHVEALGSNVVQGEVTYSGAYTTRRLVDGNGDEQWAWSELSEPVDIEAIAASLQNEMATIEENLKKVQTEPLGVVKMYSGAAVPDNYAVCDGQALSQTMYADLYKVLGTQYNRSDTADGYFCLPDLRGRFIVGRSSDSDYNTLGNTGGEKSHLLTAAESGVGNHSHTARVEGDGSHGHQLYGRSSYEDDGNAGSAIEVGSQETQQQTFDAYVNGGGHSHSVYIENACKNADSAHENRPPYFVLVYIMRTK